VFQHFFVGCEKVRYISIVGKASLPLENTHAVFRVLFHLFSNRPCLLLRLSHRSEFAAILRHQDPIRQFRQPAPARSHL
jgi:hypothetical protein